MVTLRCKATCWGAILWALMWPLKGPIVALSNDTLWSIAGIGLGQSGIAHPDAVGGLLSNPAGMGQPSFFVEWQPEWEKGNPSNPRRVAIKLDRLGYAHVQRFESEGLATHTLWAIGDQMNERCWWGLRSHQRTVGTQSVWTLDVGVLLNVLPHLTVGGVAYQWIGDHTNYPSHYQLGWAWHGSNGQWTWTLDAQQHASNDWVILNGLSLSIRDDMQLRAGVTPRQLTGGVGTAIGKLWAEYAFESPFSGDNKTHHLSVRLGAPPRNPLKGTN